MVKIGILKSTKNKKNKYFRIHLQQSGLLGEQRNVNYRDIGDGPDAPIGVESNLKRTT